jgi:large subunit ribosomal protein L19
MLVPSLRQWARSLTTAAPNYPFAKVIIPPTPPAPPTAALLKGKGIMEHVRRHILSPEKQKLLTTLFSRQSPSCIQPGSVLRVTMNHAPNVFSGVVLSIRRRGPDTSFVLRNVVNRTGVEMQFFPASPHITDIQVIKKEGSGGGKAGRRARRAKLFYLRDSPEKMTNISQGVRGVSAWYVFCVKTHDISRLKLRADCVVGFCLDLITFIVIHPRLMREDAIAVRSSLDAFES